MNHDMTPTFAIVLAMLRLVSISVHAASLSSKDVSALLASIIEEHAVPGMAAAVVHNGETVAHDVAGVRTRGNPLATPKTLLQTVSLRSCTPPVEPNLDCRQVVLDEPLSFLLINAVRSEDFHQ